MLLLILVVVGMLLHCEMPHLVFKIVKQVYFLSQILNPPCISRHSYRLHVGVLKPAVWEYIIVTVRSLVVMITRLTFFLLRGALLFLCLSEIENLSIN